MAHDDGETGTNECLNRAPHVYHISCCKPGAFGAELYEPINKNGHTSFKEMDALRQGLDDKCIKEAFYDGLAMA